jgi:solute:Na+ symporter, SSS family
MRRLSVLMLAVCMVAVFCVTASAQGVSKELKDRCISELRQVMAKETQWVRVHAAEALIRNGVLDGVEATFKPLLAEGLPKHRIGVWRTLAQAQSDPAAREQYVKSIREALLDLDGPDRIHAAETLGKIGDSKRSVTVLRAAVNMDNGIVPYARLILAKGGALEDAEFLSLLLGSYDEGIRGGTGYALRFVPSVAPETLARIALVAQAEAEDSPARIHLLNAWYVHAASAKKAAPKALLRPYADSKEKSVRYQFAEGLSLCGGAEDLPILKRLLEDDEADVRVAAANAILKIAGRQ